MHQTFNITENARLEIRACRNRVTVMGWDDAHTVETDCDARQEGDTIIIEKTHKPALRVPRNATVIIADCHSDVRAENIDGHVELLNVDGDVVLRQVRGETLIRELDGDLAIRGAGKLTGEGIWDGDVSLRNVDSIDLGKIDGDVSIRETGSIKIDSVDGDFVAAGVHGSVHVAQVDGDAVVSFATLDETSLHAEGDVVVSLPSDANADLELDAPDGDLMVRGAIKIIEQSENHLRGTIGTGGVKVKIESTDGDLIVRTIGMAGQAEHFGKMHADLGREYAQMGQEYAEMGRRIAEDVRQSVNDSLHQSLGTLARHDRRERHRHERRQVVIGHKDEPSDEAQTQEPFQAAPRGPAPGSPERQAILDAIARGEMNVDDAIKKLTGED